jgi:hypothetical protein
MKDVELETRVRGIGQILAYKEEANQFTPKYFEMKELHDRLLNKLYRREKRS